MTPMPAAKTRINVTRVETVVNQKTANSLGVTLPTDILLRADEVIE
jgi:ABC-type uncharacterized transport system substrate-binding protein